MQTLALYADENGEACQCLIHHENTSQLDRVETKLPQYSEGSTLFFIALSDHAERPDVTDEFLEEVPCEFLTL